MHNIEKSAYKNGKYIGYADGAWTIEKRGSLGWRATKQTAPFSHFYARTLKAVSAKLEALNTPAKNPGRRHSKKWDDCVRDVKKRGSATDPYAVCTATVGRRGNPSARAAAHAAARKWVILADKRRAGLYYYAGGARLATEKREAVLFPSHAGASKALQDLKALVPRNLLKLFEWSVAALT